MFIIHCHYASKNSTATSSSGRAHKYLQVLDEHLVVYGGVWWCTSDGVCTCSKYWIGLGELICGCLRCFLGLACVR